MPNYRRIYLPSYAVFITIATYQRKHIFSKSENCILFCQTVDNVKHIHPFELVAYAIMPDHLHLIIQTPDDSPNYSPVIHSIKRNFTLNYKKHYHIVSPIKLFQNRFYDHVIKDDDDFEIHMDYVHWNPVKHDLTQDPIDWEWSSFNKWIEEGFYDSDWGNKGMPSDINKMELE